MRNYKAPLFTLPMLLVSITSAIAANLPGVPKEDSLQWMKFTWVGDTFEDRSLFLREDNRNPLTIDSAKSNTVKHIGTIGVDLFQDQVLIIDYPNTRLAVTDRIPEEFADAGVFVNITLDRHGRVHVPMQIDGNTEEILFDTGSSLFPFFTTPENWAAATSQQVTDSIYTSTWGEYYYTYGAPIDDIYLGDEKLLPATCYENEYLANFIKEEGIWGVTGNAYFWNGIVIIDFTHQRFGWIK